MKISIKAFLSAENLVDPVIIRFVVVLATPKLKLPIFIWLPLSDIWLSPSVEPLGVNLGIKFVVPLIAVVKEAVEANEAVPNKEPVITALDPELITLIG